MLEIEQVIEIMNRMRPIIKEKDLTEDEFFDQWGKIQNEIEKGDKDKATPFSSLDRIKKIKKAFDG